jgi:hypothetical protein
MSGVLNKRTPQYIKYAWAGRDDNPFTGDQPIDLSVEMLTECTNYVWLQKTKALTGFKYLD